jgi:hypothetical protein
MPKMNEPTTVCTPKLGRRTNLEVIIFGVSGTLFEGRGNGPPVTEPQAP